ncbi:MAG: hypothetical protein ACE5GE_06105 [Phycisphaerae bacterium]
MKTTMWWEWIIVGTSVLIATVYVVTVAARSIGRVLGGQGCRSMGCGCGGNGPSSEKAHARELLQIAVATPSPGDPT